MTAGEGRVVGLHRSGGGVPKMPVERALVTLAGMEGDWQRNRKHHGGPDRALCLYSHELITALAAEGHPIFPGSVGENVTVAGVDWRLMQPGMSVRIATVDLELTAFAVPCRTIRDSFADRRSIRISDKVYPGWSRIYARVLRQGTIAVGDLVTINASQQ